MGSEAEASTSSITERLLDPAFWRPLLEQLKAVPRRLVLIPRPELSRPGTEVLELRLRAFDGERLAALVARPAFGQSGEALHVRAAEMLDRDQIRWDAVERGQTELIFRYPKNRRLEERVLDVVRITDAACSIESTDCLEVRHAGSECDHPPDELVIAKLLRTKGWL